MDTTSKFLFGLGLLILLVTWLPLLLRSLPLSLPIVCMGLGFLVYRAHWAHVDLAALSASRLPEFVTEFVVLIALMGAGLRIDRHFGWRRWGTAWRLLGIAMPLTIIIMTLAAVYGAGFAWPSALLIGAALAPTDPVLASNVELGPPGRGEEGEVRFGLTSEAGFNDGLAFPVVSLALALMTQTAIDASWIGVHFVWKVALAVVGGFVLGRVFGVIAFRLPRPLSQTGDGLAALGMTFLTFVAAEAIGGYGFIAVFVMALRLRALHWNQEFHRAMSDFSDQVVRLVAMVLMALFGAALATGILNALTWPDALLGVALLLLVRPLTGWFALLGSPHPAVSRAATSFFGIRGIGTLYYLVYSENQAHFPQTERVRSLIAFVVLSSVVLHGLTATPIMRRLDRIRASMSAKAAPPHSES